MNRGVMFQYFEWNSRNDGGLWRELAERAGELKAMGVSAVWMPPACKCIGGANDTGYGTYDLYDLGEFDQKGSLRTKYGTRDEYLAAVKAVQQAGMHAYADIVLNHRMGGDNTEDVEIEEIHHEDRNLVVSPPYHIKAWSNYQFAARAGKYSPLQLHWYHFNAFGANADAPDEKKIFRVKGKTWSGEVDFENANFDYLMGADVDFYHPEIREDLFNWGRWYIETTGVNGFRCDAVKHIPASFYKDWFQHLRTHFAGREIFAVAEYWSAKLDDLRAYLSTTDGTMKLFDVPLHYRLCEASKAGRDFDLRTIFDGSLVQDNPLMAVTFVDNHDSQPGQSLQSWTDDWFKPLAYALILLREQGYPCVFYGDYFGNDQESNPLTSHRKLIDDYLGARAKFMHGDQHDYLDHANCIGWVWSGNAQHPASLAVLMSNGEAGSKRMKTFHGARKYRDLTGHWPEPVTTDDNGEAEFKCLAGKVSVWCAE
jgi:alpha-amylase